MRVDNHSTRAGDDPNPEDIKGFLVQVYDALNPMVTQLGEKELELREKMAEGGASDPAILAQYQAITSELAVARNAQSSMVKMYKDVDSGIIGNFR
ncbi:hypothetical protein WL21_04545 [Burkholderia ubonensis]|uniref:EscF/YscF/HrpA family type III secretion system needle major subunit n=1 Tax=Burkholderia ubonensis TaxID=101571 RepID=UPI000759BBC1|nr:EscF/YscF/HrpA family type III secretion system needle major subunit [Burkholderia ubonensis]KVO87658.1 hypothetical protein WJ81_15515 [Burkholderia ubonensis]KVZ57275.1 hypothetical protein WL20_23300 [Burkholderia ubonensis]KVZ72973.1 hypothetical protein WL21_04545 [Burkholderia ubonensis]